MKAGKLLLLIVVICSKASQAQEYNPYKSIGKKARVLTLSKGKYDEFFDYKDMQRIGTVLFNIRTKKIVQLLNADSVFQKASDNTAASRWYSIDPLADKFASLSPYNFVENNPINLVDPDGLAPTGPIYDENGKFLGTDDQGFKGEVLFMSKLGYDFLTNNGSNQLSHDLALQAGWTIDQALADPSQGRVDMVTNAINDIVSKTEGKDFEISNLHNGQVSSYYYNAISADKINGFKNNDGSRVRVKVPAHTSEKDTKGEYKMTFNLSPSSLITRTTNGKIQGTVENIQNTAVHEGSHINGVTGEGKGHGKSYEIQMKHPTFKNVTPEYRKEIIDAYKEVKAGRL